MDLKGFIREIQSEPRFDGCKVLTLDDKYSLVLSWVDFTSNGLCGLIGYGGNLEDYSSWKMPYDIDTEFIGCEYLTADEIAYGFEKFYSYIKKLGN